MLQPIFLKGLSRCTSQTNYHSHLLRFSGLATKDKIDNIEFPSAVTLRKCITEKVPGTQSDGRHGSWNYRSRWYRQPLGKLVGAIGTVAIMGLGTALSKSQEDEEECESEATDAILKKYDYNEKTLAGKCIGTGKKGSNDIQNPSVFPPGDLEEGMTTEELRKQKERVRKARQILTRFALKVGAPGLVVAVTVNGKQVLAEGYGYADVENGVPCTPATVMRIASISKAITMTAVAKLWEENKLDLDAPIQKYITNYPLKTYNGEEVTITTKQLISHMSGIRHYKLKDSPAFKDKNDDTHHKCNKNLSEPRDKYSSKEMKDNSSGSHTDSEKMIVVTSTSKNDKYISKIKEEEKKNEEKPFSYDNHSHRQVKNKKKKKEVKEEYEYDLEEYKIKEQFETVHDSLKLFQNDELFFKPGEGFLYSTHGWTVVSAVVEAASQKPFHKIAKRLFYELGLVHTYLDVASPIIYNRARYYIRDKHGLLQNAPYVDNSYKWAGGGFLSTVGDLCKFGNAMLYASQQEYGGETPRLPGYLKASTIRQMWTPIEGTTSYWGDNVYGMGWFIIEDKNSYQFCLDSRHHAYHTGGAVGASSILLILPQKVSSNDIPPQGVVVAIITNMQGVGCYDVAMEVAELFDKN